MSFLKLIRFPNLLIIILSQYLFRYCILIPLMKFEPGTVVPVLSHFDFALVVLSTVLIAAAGYAINDYFDIRIDRINKPEKIIVGRLISRRKAMLTHTVFNIIAVLIGCYISYKLRSFSIVSIYIVVSILLWLYSLKYKAYFLVGNIIVSAVSGMTILLVWIVESYGLRHQMMVLYDPSGYIKILLWSYVIYAFVISLIREIIKDIEDYEGDKKVGCSTIPVVLGVKVTKYFLAALCLFSVASLVYLSTIVYTQDWKILFWYIIVLLTLPLLYMTFIIFRATNKSDFNFLSNITKFVMVAGVASMAVVYSLLKFV